MMKVVLIVATMGSQVSVDTSHFKNMSSCENAKGSIIRMLESTGWQKFWVSPDPEVTAFFKRDVFVFLDCVK